MKSAAAVPQSPQDLAEFVRTIKFLFVTAKPAFSWKVLWDEKEGAYR